MEFVQKYWMQGVAVVTLIALLVFGGVVLFKKLPDLSESLDNTLDAVTEGNKRGEEERAKMLGRVDEVLEVSNNIQQQNNNILERQNNLLATQRTMVEGQRTLISDTNAVRALIGTPVNGNTTLFASVATLSNDLANVTTLLNQMDNKLDDVLEILRELDIRIP